MIFKQERDIHFSLKNVTSLWKMDQKRARIDLKGLIRRVCTGPGEP